MGSCRDSFRGARETNRLAGRVRPARGRDDPRARESRPEQLGRQPERRVRLLPRQRPSDLPAAPARGRPPPDRGYEACVAESRDGIAFTDLWKVHKDDLGSTSLERFNLHRPGRALPALHELRASGRRPLADRRARVRYSGRVRPRAGAERADAGRDGHGRRQGSVRPARRARLLPVREHLPHRGGACADLPRDELRRRAVHVAGEVFGVGEGWDRYQARLSGIVDAGRCFVGFYDGSAGSRRTPRSASASRSRSTSFAGSGCPTRGRGWCRRTPRDRCATSTRSSSTASGGSTTSTRARRLARARLSRVPLVR